MVASFPIGEFLVRKELISPRAIAQALKEQESKRQRLISMLILRAELEIDDAATVLSEQSGYPAAYERHLERRDTSLAKVLSGALCAQYAVIPIGRTAGGRIVVGARDPSPALVTALEEASELTIELCVVPAILVERLVRATFNLAIEPNAPLPGSKLNMPRARSVSALYADSQPPHRVGTIPVGTVPEAIDPTPPRASRPVTAKVVIPERKSAPAQAITDFDSAPILLDRPKRPSTEQAAAQPPGDKTLPRMPVVRAPALRIPSEDEVTQPRRPVSAPPTTSEVQPAVAGMIDATERNPTMASLRTTSPANPPPPPEKARPPTRPPPPPPPRPVTASDSEPTRPARPIDPDAPQVATGSSRNQQVTAQAPNIPVPADARAPDRRQHATRPAPNTPIPAEARPPVRASEPPPIGSIALSDLAVEAGATASDPAVVLPLAERPAERAKSVSEMFAEIASEPTPPPLAAVVARPSAPALPPPPMPRPPTETTVVTGAPRPPTEPTAVSAPPRPPPAPGTGSVEAVGKEIERAISRATADRVLITFAGSRFKSALLVMIADGVARGARGQGPRLTTVQTIVVPIEAPSILQVAHDTRAVTREAPASPTQDRLAELLGTPTPLAVPIVVDAAVVAALLVGEPTGVPVTDADLLTVVGAFATAYKRLYKPK